MKEKPIGILSGTFDPIHLGHTHLAAKIHEICDLQKILIIPCQQSPFKEKPIASTEDRLKMIELTTKDLPYLSIEDYEIKRPNISYTLDTLEYLAKKYPNIPLILTMGIDAFNRFDEWRKPQEILDLAHILIVTRPGHEKTTNQKVIEILAKREIFDPKQLQNKKSGLIYITNIDPLPISATEIRKLIKQKKDPSHLLNKDVWEYINDKNLYRHCCKNNTVR